MDKLNVLKIFIAVCDHGSFAGAAAALGTDASTISKAVTRLEEELQYQLFYRSTRKLQKTEAAGKYLETVRRILVELDECEKQLKWSNDQPEGVLKLNLPVAYGRMYVLPLLTSFSQLYPAIKLDITFSDEYVDIIEQGIDISIRTGTVADSRMIMQQLSPMDFLTCASPAYLKDAPELVSTEDFSNHSWIRFRFKQTGKLMPVLMKNAQTGVTDNVPVGKHYTVDDGQALLDLCKAGSGILQGPHFLFRSELKSGELVSLFPPLQPKGYGVFLLYPKRRFLPKKVDVFIAFLKEALRRSGENATHCWSREISSLNDW